MSWFDLVTAVSRSGPATSAGWDIKSAFHADDVDLAIGARIPILITDRHPLRRYWLARVIHDESSAAGPLVTFCERSRANGRWRPQPHVSVPSLFERSRGGTLFIDEMSSMSSDTQAELCQVLTAPSFRHFTDGPVPARTRLIAGTGVPLRRHVENGTFDERLFYWLNTIHLVARDGV